MMAMNKKYFILILLFIPVFLSAQEIITGLSTNPTIGEYIKNHKANGIEKTGKSVYKTLPFIDDFSGSGIFPDSSLWTNKNVFINSNYPYLPPTVGVATFDALNDTGALYTDANAYGFVADSLTSQPIRLDSVFGSSPASLKIKDSIYFSFLYQPQGIGNAPEKDDSLVLEFYAPLLGKWKRVWASEGTTLAAFHSKFGVWFKQVMIPIKDSTTYFHKDFRFRFYNYASLTNNSQPTWAGNVDQWHIDYVFLGKGRNKADSVYKDIAFVQPAPSFLKNYYAMPWKQFLVNPSAELKDNISMTISNLDTVTYNMSYKYDIFDASGSILHTYNGGSFNIEPYVTMGYQTYQPHAQPPVDYTFPSSTTDSALFVITHTVKEGILGDSRRSNDTVSFNQKFYNYYAYDDGSPEAGYGLTPAHAKLAYRFKLNQSDTIRAVRMFFNQTYNNSSQRYFNLMIWADDNQKPGTVLYKVKSLKPQYEDSINKFYNYKLDTVLVLSGTFYIGWEQLDDSNLNLGYDRNSNAQANILFNTAGNWLTSGYTGALMIRPVFGNVLPPVASISNNEGDAYHFVVYPNPVNSDILKIKSIEMSELSDVSTVIYNIYGRKVFNAPFSTEINVSGFTAGVYFIQLTLNNKTLGIPRKFMIIK